MFFGKLYASHE